MEKLLQFWNWIKWKKALEPSKMPGLNLSGSDRKLPYVQRELSMLHIQTKESRRRWSSLAPEFSVFNSPAVTTCWQAQLFTAIHAASPAVWKPQPSVFSTTISPRDVDKPSATLCTWQRPLLSPPASSAPLWVEPRVLQLLGRAFVVESTHRMP